MTNHYDQARAHVDEVEQRSDELGEAYAADASRVTLGRLHHELGVSLKLAAIHADLAIAQALQDLRTPR